MAPRRSDISETEKMAFTWRTEEAIFRKPKNSLCRGPLQMRFFGYRKNGFSSRTEKAFFSSNCQKAILWKPNIINFTLLPEKVIFRIPKKFPFSLRLEEAIFRKTKKRHFRGAQKKRFSGKQKNSFFVSH